MGGSSKQPTTTTQVNEPPSYLVPYLQDTAKQAQGIYNSGGPDYYPGQTVAPFAPATQQGLEQITNLAQQGGNLTPAANAQLLSTINGTNSVNPFLAGAVQSANAPLYDQFKNETIPQLQTIFARTGGTGGSAEGFGAERAATALGRGMAENAGTLAYNSAEAERQRQLQAVSMAPQMDAARFGDANALLGVGATQQGQTQAEIQAAMDKYNYEQNLPSLRLNQYIQQLQGGASGGITTGVSRQAPGSSALGLFGGAAGGAASGAMIGTAVGSPGIGTAIGAGLGGLYGLGSSNGWF